MSTPNLDDIDRAILRIVQEDAQSSLEFIASQAGASVATVHRRLKALKENGVISGELMQVAPEKVGYPMTFLILVELERERIDQLDAFRRKIKNETLVQQCYYITGDADFALIVLAKDMQDFQLLTRRLFFEDSNVKRFRTSVVMDHIKTSIAVPV